MPHSERHAERKGSTTPRLFTPPLPENCDQSRSDGCLCGCGLNPETSWGFEVIRFLERVLKWTLLPWQKWLYIHALEKDETRKAFRYKTIILLIARQNGKTQWLKGIALWKLYLDGAKRIVSTAQTLEYAENTLAEAVADVKATPMLKKEFIRFSQTNGKFKMLLTTGREWRVATATRKGGRSLPVDMVMLDELREHQTWEAWNALTPTTTARKRSLNVTASNAGDATSCVLRSLRDGAISKIETGRTAETLNFLAEWSIPDDVDAFDPQYWPMANPSMGYLFSENELRGQAEAMQIDNPGGWKTEHCCQWVKILLPGVMPAEDWAATTDPNSARKAEAKVWAALDVNFERSSSYIAVAAERENGDQHVEVVAAQRGTDWTIEWLKERADKFEGVVIQARGAPASGLIEPLREAGVTVIELGGGDLTRAYGEFYDALLKHRVWHRPSPALDEAALTALARTLGDAWVIDRKNSPTDASPLVACIQAMAGHWLQEPKARSAYEDEELMVV
ncbi:terminase large subunit [Mycobacteroides abscessus]|uniref:terminase large subunit n=1 Tax=Mycobacteroides abscessus TaxID=36809 RepID=UPI0005E4AD08|nr:terminase large subunit [Mycobacteroides abscessus]CPR79317.1 phage terminase%2C large subunit%2C putative [Mycobacteroides abscessus]CPR88466.1 phage terminase%2C large subunit%2C putative [Mycobacteroides abscessus]CPS43407.1 phage terminase%2C large subunit%2C putative [Mycobacteroides abscessus]CPV03195.1 phage terminase%2C large subunit%2C putative [Mycobacteroides abscessus]